MAGWPWGWFPWWGRAWTRGGGPGCAAFSPAGPATVGPDAHSSAAPSDRTCWTSWWLSLPVRSLLLILYRWLRKVFYSVLLFLTEQTFAKHFVLLIQSQIHIYRIYSFTFATNSLGQLPPHPTPQYFSYFYTVLFSFSTNMFSKIISTDLQKALSWANISGATINNSFSTIAWLSIYQCVKSFSNCQAIVTELVLFLQIDLLPTPH